MESQRPILYMALLFTAFLLYQAWVQDHRAPDSPSAPAGPAAQTAAVPGAEGGEDVPGLAAPGQPEAKSATPAAATLPGTPIHVRTDVLDVTLTTRGGDVTDVLLPTYPVSLDQPDEPFRLLQHVPPRYLAQTGLLAEGDAARAPTHHADFQAEKTEYTLADGQDELVVPLRWQGPDGITVEKRYVFRRGDFLVRLEYVVHNGSDQPWQARQYRQLRRGPVSEGGNVFMAHSFTGAAYYTDHYEKLAFDDFADEPLDLTVQGGWVAMIQHYFLSAWLPASDDEQNRLYTKVVPGPGQDEYLIGMAGPPVSVAPGQSATVASRFYVGPKLQKQLAEIAPGLELTADYGIFTVIAKPVFWLLSWLHALLGNWGWAIVAVTVLIKLLFYKLSETSYKSMARMRAVAPKLQAIKERYADDKQRQQQAMMELYKKEKINPLGGCLPVLIQIPVFIALYWVLLESVELRQAPWILWIRDLSVRDPYFVLPLLMGVTMFVQQKLNPPPPDPLQAKVMMVLPIVFTVFFAFFPAGLVLYWFTNNLLSIAQQWVITRKIEQGMNKA